MKNFNLNRLKYQNKEWMKEYIFTMQMVAFCAGFGVGSLVTFGLILICNLLGW